MRRVATTPSYRMTLWFAAHVLWFSSIPALVSFLVREQRSGAFPVDGDSIGIPIMGWTIVTVVLAPVLNIAWWWLSRGYPGSVPLFVTDRSTNAKARIVSLGLVALAVTLGVGVVWELFSGAPEMSAVVLSWCYLTLAFRAAFVNRRTVGERVAA